MSIITKKPEKKLSVETLQEDHLVGPAQESLQDIAAELKESQVVAASEVPLYEEVIFRNQRDPGHVLTFHYSSSTHPFKMYNLIDGSKQRLPVEVIRNLEACRENFEKYRRNSEGIPEIYIAGYKSHFVCERV